MYKMHEKVMYHNRPAYVVGVTYGHNGKLYDLSRKPNSAAIDYKAVQERHLRPYDELAEQNRQAVESTSYVAQNGWAMPRIVKG